MLWIRCCFGIFAYTIMTISLKYVPLYLIGIIGNTMPIWIVIMEFCVQHKPICKMDIVCMIGCFIGIIIITLSNDYG